MFCLSFLSAFFLLFLQTNNNLMEGALREKIKAGEANPRPGESEETAFSNSLMIIKAKYMPTGTFASADSFQSPSGLKIHLGISKG